MFKRTALAFFLLAAPACANADMDQANLADMERVRTLYAAQRHDEAIALLRRLATIGHSPAMIALAHECRNPWGPAYDRAEALRWADAARYAHDGWAQLAGPQGAHVRALILLDGGTPAEGDEAVASLERLAASGGSREYADDLLRALDEGAGPTFRPDRARATTWYRRLAEEGRYSDYMDVYAYRLAHGIGTPVDAPAALGWYERYLAESGEEASYGLILLLRAGAPGVPADKPRAAMMAYHLAMQGDDACQRIYDALLAEGVRPASPPPPAD